MSNTAGLSNSQSLGAATKALLKAAPGAVYSLRVTNKNAGLRYFQLIDKATAPANTDAALFSWAIPAGSGTVPGVLLLNTRNFAPAAITPANGLGWAISTTAGTFTDSATAAEHDVDINYR